MEIINSKDKWEQVLVEVGSFDFYHTYDYHIISKKEREQPVLLVYREDDALVALPLLIRPIFDTEYFDATSVYGYPGPISKGVGPDSDLGGFNKNLALVLKEKKIISAFSRLNPYIPFQDAVLQSLGRVDTIGKVVNIDLGLTLEEQRAHYGKSTKNRTNKCRRVSEVVAATTEEQIHTFIDIYYENMDRLSANKDYYFSREYFFEFLNCTGFNTDILLVMNQETNEAMAGSMFVKTNDIVQFHLSGTRTDYLHLAPANVFLDEMRIRATDEGYRIFNLGGGLGGREDSLFNFKSSFSKDHRDFKVWKYVVDETVYHQLSEGQDVSENDGFFPLYRKPR